MQVRKSIIQTSLIRIFSILLPALLSFPAGAQKIPFDNYTIQNGLPQNTVNSICQDHSGYIWFATQVGAARYDGYDFEYFSTSNGLPDNFVNCLLVSNNGHIWFGTEGGIADYNGTGFTVYTVEQGLVSNHVDQLFEDKAGHIWAITAWGLSVITPDSVITHNKDNALMDNSVLAYFVDSRGRVHISTYPVTGLTIFDDPLNFHKYPEEEIISDILEDTNGEIWYATQGRGIRIGTGNDSRRLGYVQGLTDEIVLCMMLDHKGRVWCGTYVDGFFVYENGAFRRISGGRHSEPVAYKIHEDGHHRIWFLTYDDGVWLYDDGDFRYFTTENNLVHNIVTGITEDKFGNIWLATAGGASKYGRVIFEIYDTEQGLPENHVSALFYDSRGRIWCGTYFHLMYIYRGQLYSFGEDKGFGEGVTPLSFAEDAQRNIYIGTDIGLLYYNGRSIQPVLFNGSTTEDIQFFSLLYTEGRELWCATDSGIYIYQNGAARPPVDAERLINQKVNDLELVGDRVYCATEGGVSVFALDGRFISSYTTSDSLSSNVCLDLAHDFQNNVWVATDRGLSKIEAGGNNGINRFETGDGPSSSTTYFVEITDSTSLWIGTERGVRKLNMISGQADYYGYEDGFYPLETNERAVARGEGNELWIGTIAGLVHYIPKYDVKDPVPPDLILFPPIVDGEKYVAEVNGKGINPSFPYNRNSLTFSFTGIHTTISEKNRFSYILEGYDEEWTPPPRIAPLQVLNDDASGRTLRVHLPAVHRRTGE